MKLLTFLFLLSLSFQLMASPLSLAEKHVGKSLLDNYLHAPVSKVLKEIESIPANQKKTIGKSILLNLYGHNFDTTLIHDGKKMISFTRVFYDEETAPDIYQEIEETGKKYLKTVRVKSKPKPGTYYDYHFKKLGLYFRFTQNKKIQYITIKKRP